MSISAKIVAHSLNTVGEELITMEIECHRFILPEFNTHRCLTADTELWFDLPNGGEPRLYKMTVGDFYRKWNFGTKQHIVGSKKDYFIRHYADSEIISAKEISEDCGLSASSIRLACRKGLCKVQNPNKARSEDFKIKVSDFKVYRDSIGTRSYSMLDRLKGMQVRMLNEETNQIENTTITDIWNTGIKKVYELIAGDFKIKATADHPILTVDGWKELGDLTQEDYVLTCGSGTSTPKDPITHKKINGKWTTVWNRQNKDVVISRQGDVCADCGETFNNYDLHHIKPVHLFPEHAFDIENVVALCRSCHNKQHEKQGWQTGSCLIGKPVRVDLVTICGEETVYDLSVASDFHNFIANGVVVHNCFSRNFQSSRAIPVKRMIEMIRENPAYPVHWGKNQAGMQAYEESEEAVEVYAWCDIENIFDYKLLAPKEAWERAMSNACELATAFDEAGYHKQIVNRLIEPFMWQKGVVTATREGFESFFKLRSHHAAQPEIKALSDAMKEALSNSTPIALQLGEWHMPYVKTSYPVSTISGKVKQVFEDSDGNILSVEQALKISASCCAQVSYRKLDDSFEKAERIYDMLNLNSFVEEDGEPPHASPCEHQARHTVHINMFNESGNFACKGWHQYRKALEQDNNIWHLTSDQGSSKL